MNFSVMESVTKKSQKFINYLTEISATKEFNLHSVGWNKTVILRNCSVSGTLVDLSRSDQTTKLWIQLSLKIFELDNDRYGIFACLQCGPSILTMSFD